MSQVEKIVRIPIIPGFNDTEKNINATGRYLSRLNFTNVEILPYHELGVSKYEALGREYSFNSTPPRAEALESIKTALEQYQLTVRIEGLINRKNRESSYK